jgi:hypothetical protein
MPELIRDLLNLPDQVRRGDFVLKLSEGIERADKTLAEYVVTDQLVDCFDQALSLVRDAVRGNTSKGCYLHGSFGSGKSHFMAVLHLLLQGNTRARSITALASVVTKHNDWTQGKRFLLLPFHMIGKESMEAAILGGYAEQIHRLHPEASVPGLFRSERMLQDAAKLRQKIGDQAFFATLNERHTGSSDDWGDLGGGWTAESFEAACQAPAASEQRVRLVSDLVEHYYTAARDAAGFVELGDGLAIISRHAKSLGYDAVVLFLDELILWLASRAADVAFVNREGPKLANLVEAQTANRPIPLVSFVARQRDLKELVGEHVTGVDYLRFSDSLNWWEARFSTIKLADRNLPAIAEKRVLAPRSEAARQQIDAAFEEATRVRAEVMNVLLAQDADRTLFRKIYPFSPAFMDTLVEMSFLLQRERTALKVMLQILIKQGDRLKLGDIVPVGDLFDAIAEGDEAVSEEIRRRFEYAKRLYDEKFKIMLEQKHGMRFDELGGGTADNARALALRNDDRLVKTLLLAALAPNVPVLRNLDAARLAALNHGTIRSPIPGREPMFVLNKCREWGAAVGQLKIGEDPQNPSVSIQLSEVDTDSIVDRARTVFDNAGNRIRLVRNMVFKAMGIEDRDTLTQSKGFTWRGTPRACTILFDNVRKLPSESLKSTGEDWTVIIDWPFDEDESHTPADDRARVDAFRDTNPNGTQTLVMLPSFLNRRAIQDLGTLVTLDLLLRGDNLANHSQFLSPANRETAAAVLQNQCSQLRQRMSIYLENAYGISNTAPEALSATARLEGEEHFASLRPGLNLRPPAAANLEGALLALLDQALKHQYPAHPEFESEVDLRPGTLRQVMQELNRAAQDPHGHIPVERTLRKDLRLIANPLRLGRMEEQYFQLLPHWRDQFERCHATSSEPWTIANLDRWMDQPERTGLPRNLRNLVILTVATQTNRSLFRKELPYEGPLDNIPSDVELRTVDLPADSDWQKAVGRAGHLFGLTVSPLLSAANVARVAAGCRSFVEQHREAAESLANQLEGIWQTRPDLARNAARLTSSRAARDLMNQFRTDRDCEVIRRLSAWQNASTDPAVGTSLRKANEVLQAIKHVRWQTIEMAAKLTGDQQPAVEAMLRRLREGLEADEHAVALAASLHGVESDAMRLIDTSLKTLQTPPLAVASPSATRPPPLQDPNQVPVALPPTPAGTPCQPTRGMRKVAARELDEVIREIRTHATGWKNPAIRISWEISGE